MKKKLVSKEKLKTWLDELLEEFNQAEYLDTDPVGIVHGYKTDEDKELVAFIAALFSFGNIKSIRQSLRLILNPLGKRPSEALIKLSPKEIEWHYKDSYYRFYKPKDIQFLLLRLQQILKRQSNLNLRSSFEGLWETNVIRFIDRLREVLTYQAPKTNGIRFMFADPHAGCAKRWHMLLRWMSRKDEIDLGLWDFIPSSKLLVPLDTHVFELSQALGLTNRKTNGLAAVEEVTESLREFDAEDPLRYDFALCRLGVLGLKKERIKQLLTA